MHAFSAFLQGILTSVTLANFHQSDHLHFVHYFLLFSHLTDLLSWTYFVSNYQIESYLDPFPTTIARINFFILVSVSVAGHSHSRKFLAPDKLVVKVGAIRPIVSCASARKAVRLIIPLGKNTYFWGVANHWRLNRHEYVYTKERRRYAYLRTFLTRSATWQCERGDGAVS